MESVSDWADFTAEIAFNETRAVVNCNMLI